MPHLRAGPYLGPLVADARPITHARVLRIALPMVLSNMTVPLIGAMDTVIIGQLGAAAPIGAVGIGALILGALYWVFGFLRMGTTGLAAQAVGAGRTDDLARILVQSLTIGALGGIGLILFQIPVFAFGFFVSPASAEVETMARSYMDVRIFSAPAAIALYAVNGWLIAQERTGQVMVLQIFLAALNMALNVLFVLGLDWGILGAAWASFIAEWAGLCLGLWLCRAGLAHPALRRLRHLFDMASLRHMADVNRDILIRSLALQAIFISFTFFAADLGDVPLAANQLLMQFLTVSAYALDGFAFAAETMVGQAFGAGQVRRLRRSVVLSGFWIMACAGVTTLALLIAAPAVLPLMTTATDVVERAQVYVMWVALAPLLGAPSWVLDGVFIGATRARDMRNMMLISLVGYAVLVWALVPQFGNHGLWLALLGSFVIRGLTMAVRYPALERIAALNDGVK